MIKGNIFCKKESEEDGVIRMPEPMIHDSGHLSPNKVNIPMLSPRPDDNYQIPSPCQIEYIENARSPIYLPQGQNNYSRRDDFMTNGDVDTRNNSAMYHMHPPELVRNNTFTPSTRLNHDYQPQTHMFDTIKTEMRDDTRGMFFSPFIVLHGNGFGKLRIREHIYRKNSLFRPLPPS